MTAERIDPRFIRTRQLVVPATRRAVLERGYGGLSIEGVARRAGVAKTSVYRQWRSPAELLLSAAEPELNPPPAGALTAGAFSQALREQWATPEARAMVLAVLEGARHEPSLAAACDAFFAAWRSAVVGVLSDGPHATAVADGVIGAVLVDSLSRVGVGA